MIKDIIGVTAHREIHSNPTQNTIAFLTFLPLITLIVQCLINITGLPGGHPWDQGGCHHRRFTIRLQETCDSHPLTTHNGHVTKTILRHAILHLISTVTLLQDYHLIDNLISCSCCFILCVNVYWLVHILLMCCIFKCTYNLTTITLNFIDTHTQHGSNFAAHSING